MAKQTKKELNLDLEPVAGAFAQAVAEGKGREFGCFGTRGDGKTFAAFIAMVMHAQLHHQAGFPLPFPWMGVTDTHRSHELKTCRSLLHPSWMGAWKLFENNHVAVFRQGPSDLVHIDLFGVEDQGALDRLRMETCGVWFEEPAPSTVLVQSSGISVTAWSLALTSQRVASHCHPAMMTLNYPDAGHWTWRRFMPGPGTAGHHPDHAERVWFRIPPGERASAEDRAEWARALEDRPDLYRRLLAGEPGAIQIGEQVAVGFNEDFHVSRERLHPIRGEPLYFGLDFGLTPTITIAQEIRGRILVYASLACERGGIRQHLEYEVIPLLTRHASWCLQDPSMVLGGYDPSGDNKDQSDIEQSAQRVVESLIPGYWEPGQVSWPGRRDPMLAVFNRAIWGEPGLLLDPIDCEGLISALSGGWYYPTGRDGQISHDLPRKPNHPHEDYGDSLCYLIGRIAPSKSKEPAKPIMVNRFFDARGSYLGAKSAKWK